MTIDLALIREQPSNNNAGTERRGEEEEKQEISNISL
jgi:hypothetical protein